MFLLDERSMARVQPRTILVVGLLLLLWLSCRQVKESRRIVLCQVLPRPCHFPSSVLHFSKSWVSWFILLHSWFMYDRITGSSHHLFIRTAQIMTETNATTQPITVATLSCPFFGTFAFRRRYKIVAERLVRLFHNVWDQFLTTCFFVSELHHVEARFHTLEAL